MLFKLATNYLSAANKKSIHSFAILGPTDCDCWCNICKLCVMFLFNWPMAIAHLLLLIGELPANMSE